MTSETQKALVVAAMLAALFYFARRPDSETPVGNEYPDAMVVVPPVGMGGSTRLDEWAKENNIELRRYTDGVDLANAEKWIAELYAATEGTRPSAAVRLDGKIVVVPVNDDLLQSLDNLK